MKDNVATQSVPIVRHFGEHKLAKFIVVGVTNNLIGYGAFVLLSLLGTAAIPAMTVSYCIGMIVSFVGNRKWTFGHRENLGTTLIRFLIGNAVGYGLNFALLWFLVKQVGLPQIPVQLFATGCVAATTFLVMRLWVFRSKPEGADD